MLPALMAEAVGTITDENQLTMPIASRRAIFAWAMYDFANSGYTTVVLTAVYNAYFVGVIVGNAHGGGGTLLWTVAMAVANLVVLLTAPVIGAIADAKAAKKHFLALTTVGCVLFTALLGFAGPGEVVLAMGLVIAASIMFAAGENLIAAFLPELVPAERVGRVSGYGWSLGYIGGLLVLGLCLAYITFAEARGATAAEFVPVTLQHATLDLVIIISAILIRLRGVFVSSAKERI